MSSPNHKVLGFLPDLCNPQIILRTLLIAEVLAIVLALSATSELNQFLLKLGATSLFVQWTTLISTFLICLTSKFQTQTTVLKTSLVVLAVVMFFTFFASILAIMGVSYRDGIITEYWDSLFILKNIFISIAVTSAALRYFYVAHQWEAYVQSDSEAKYDALQSRMRPHFLFNSLNTVAQLVHDNPDRAEEAILDLADIFRTTLDKRSRISLQEELDVTLRYLRMEGLRLGKRRLTVIWDMDEHNLPFEMEIPPLLLQPLVENAIYHGIQPRLDGGTLGISLYDAGDRLDISVTNPIAPSDTNGHQKGNHIAQENMKKRLRLAYGDKANLKIQKTPHQYRVSFSIPKE